jgi:hypothetical protein
LSFSCTLVLIGFVDSVNQTMLVAITKRMFKHYLNEIARK